MSFPRYERYMDSEVEWLGEVPEHWDVIPLKRLADFINGDAFKPTEWAESGVPIIRIQNLNGGEEFNYYEGEVEPRYLVHDGDLLFGWSGNRGTSFGPFLWRRKEVCALNQHIFRVVPATLPKQALYWTLKAVTAHVEDQAHGIIGMVHITKGDLGAINVPIPPEEEHRTLATFLDRETAKIDALVEEQRRLIELLKEKRQAVISHAVTKGLNPNIPMKSSDVDWIGQVPGHWAVTRLGYFATVENGTTPSRENLEYWTDGQIPWLASGEVNQLNITEATEFITEQALAESSLRLLPEGTIVVGLVGQGKTRGMSAILRMTATINQNLAAICPGPKILSEYILYLFQAMYESLREDGRGGNQAAINCKMLTSLQIPVPTISEQKVISAFLDKLTEETNTLESEADDAIRLLQERRSALISAAVTGKIDVRNYTPKEAA
jgi:type I restriction enzyme S subunit